MAKHRNVHIGLIILRERIALAACCRGVAPGCVPGRHAGPTTCGYGQCRVSVWYTLAALREEPTAQ